MNTLIIDVHVTNGIWSWSHCSYKNVVTSLDRTSTSDITVNIYICALILGHWNRRPYSCNELHQEKWGRWSLNPVKFYPIIFGRTQPFQHHQIINHQDHSTIISHQSTGWAKSLPSSSHTLNNPGGLTWQKGPISPTFSEPNRELDRRLCWFPWGHQGCSEWFAQRIPTIIYNGK